MQLTPFSTYTLLKNAVLCQMDNLSKLIWYPKEILLKSAVLFPYSSKAKTIVKKLLIVL